MNISEHTFNEDDFVDYGNLLDKNSRKEIIEYWNSKINNQNVIVSDKIRKFTSLIDELFTGSVSHHLRNNKGIMEDVKSSIFQGFEELARNQIKDHPYMREEGDFINWSNVNQSEFIKNNNKYLKTIKSYYSLDEYNSPFFKKKVNEIREKSKNSTRKNLEKLDLEKKAIREEMLDRWDGLLNQKKDQWFIDELDKWRKQYLDKLYDQIDKFEQMKDLLGPFTDELGRLWDLSKGAWKNIGFDILKQYSKLIENEPELLELAEYLGRMQGEREEVIEKLIEITDLRPIFEVEESGKEELVGIHESDDISHLLPSEVALLGDETTKTLFYLKLSEKKLLTYDFYGYSMVEEEYTKTESIEVPEGETKGPIIICVDTSGSMHGVPERVAKTLCFAILRVALLQNRKCYLISFSTAIKTIELTDFHENLPLLIQFLSRSFHGGTDATPALTEAVKMLKTETYQMADVLMISDFIMGNLQGQLTSNIQEQQNNGTEFHSLVIANSANQRVLDVFDNNWVYDMGSPKPCSSVLENLENLRKKKSKE